MGLIEFDAAEMYEPDDGWSRVPFAGSNRLLFEYFAKLPGSSAPMQDHENSRFASS